MDNLYYITTGSRSDCRCRGHKFKSQLSNRTFMEIDHEISVVIISRPLIQEGMLMVTGKSMCTNTGLSHRGWSLTGKVGLGLTFIMLNKLRCQAHFSFSASQFT